MSGKQNKKTELFYYPGLINNSKQDWDYIISERAVQQVRERYLRYHKQSSVSQICILSMFSSEIIFFG